MILNLTQHAATPDQLNAGVRDATDRAALAALLTFADLPSSSEIEARARSVAALAASEGAHTAMIGGAPFFMSALERALLWAGITPTYAFSRRESVEEAGADGAVVKRAVFRHVGFVEMT